ncbi:DUF2339 domain-containing protein [Pacificoceanicola onchidii]|uniref:DUF2339 domain-containing protein n=1 Tax=Pacificoceanicola onchidii TaxID=2562685 RepID=UPI0010A551A4|nr:DUF2339 domain-containing protein [Pacificoceanicola onchidii]
MSDDAIIALIIIALLAVPVAIIYLLIAVSGLKRQVRALQAQLGGAPNAVLSHTPVSDPTVADEPKAQASEAPPSISPAPEDAAPSPFERAAKPSKATVFRRDRLNALQSWLRENWFYAAAAASLALAGLFFVQYGIEHGLLPPAARVAAALGFGAVLIGAGEWIRRRFGDDETSSTAYLPSVLSGAGLVSLFGGVTAARLLYDLISPMPAFATLAAIAAGGLVLGWIHGPLLAAISLIGGMAAPFLVGGSSDIPEAVLPYFALITALGLGIDTLRRWAWISVLSLALGIGAGWLLLAGVQETESFAIAFGAFAAALTLLATLIPARSLAPDHGGPSFLETVLRRADWPIFPARLSLGTVLAAIPALLLISQTSVASYWTALGLTAGLAMLFALWSLKAPALQDHALPPAALAVALIGLDNLNGPVFRALSDHLAETATQTENPFPLTVTLLVGIATLISATFALRALRGSENRIIWAGAAALIAPLAGLLLEAMRAPSEFIGAYPWALHGLALGAVMTLMAERFAKQDPADKARISLPILSALACLAFALAITLTDTALTLAIAATILAAAALDRRFDLPLMGAYIAAGVVGLGLRLTIEPGLPWATETGIFPMLLAYGGSLAALLTGFVLLRARERPKATIFLESAAWSTAGMTLSLTLFHVIRAFAPQSGLDTHWGLGLMAAIWIGVAMAQLFRQEIGGWLKPLRIALAGLFGLIAGVLLFVILTDLNPLLSDETVLGQPLLTTLIPAYLLPAAFLGLTAWRLTAQPRNLRISLAGAGGLLATIWAVLTIRHVWQGGAGMNLENGMGQPELYTYTVALLLTGALLFYQALAKRSDALRHAGVAIIALAVAKVFVIDISGLSGLVRVFSFLLLGLSLAGLAWFNRWVQTRATED